MSFLSANLLENHFFHELCLSILVVCLLIHYICGVKSYGLLRRLLVWFLRIGHCRGFGVQSPWAYGFVTEVINERLPFNEYKALHNAFPQASYIERKDGEFFHRLANFSQLRTVFSCYCDTSTDELFEAYVMAGCRKANYVRCNSFFQLKKKMEDRLTEHPVLVVLDASSAIWETTVKCMQGMLKDGDFLVALDINAMSEAKKRWSSILNNLANGLTFDLYYMGVVYFDSKRYLEHFKINF